MRTLIYHFATVSLVFGGLPNLRLQECCATLPEVDGDCAERFCNFQTINSEKVIPFLTTCFPRGRTVRQIWKCVASRHDHSQCCINQGVSPLCMPFCRAHEAVPTDLSKYIVCLDEFEKYRRCFRTYIQHNGAYHETHDPAEWTD